MRGGITCVKCNTSRGSLKFFQPIKDKYRCATCGFKGIILAGEDKRLYLVEYKSELPKVQPVETKSKPKQKPNKVIKADQKRNQTINRIIHLVDILNLKEYSGWDDIDFRNITDLRYKNEVMTEELAVLLEDLERIYDKRLASPRKTDYLLTVDLSDKNWRMNIPESIKNSLNDWNTCSIEMIELYAKDMVRSVQGKDKKELQAFLALISDLPTKQLKSTVEEQEEKLVFDYEEEEVIFVDEEEQEEEVIFKDEEVQEEEVIFIYEEELDLEKWQENAPDRVKELIPNWNTLSMKNLQERVLDLISKTKSITARIELDDYVATLDDLLLYDDDLFDDEIGEEITYDPLAVIEKYKHGAINEKETFAGPKLDDSWRKLIPFSLKNQISDWKTAPMQSIYEKAKLMLSQSSGNAREQLMEFVVELSQIIYDISVEDEDEIEAEEEILSRDDARDAVMSLVEMIILPHLEVMDIIQKKGGNITFSNLWYKPFTDQLKEEVKDRDEWKCVICESDTDLHVHHKIPREKGGIHHRDNLVTLCASCHAAVETADVQHAFKKCLANFHRNKYSNINRENLSLDKKLLKEEVESKLDSLLNELNNRDEHKLMEEVVGVMKRLEIIFYE